jgi:hypothetical protein
MRGSGRITLCLDELGVQNIWPKLVFGIVGLRLRPP